MGEGVSKPLTRAGHERWARCGWAFQRDSQWPLGEILRSDNGREFIAAKLTGWLADEGVECAFIEKGRPNQNGIVERLNGLMRRHVLDAEDLATLLEARVVISDWTIEYNQHRPHGALGGTPRPISITSNT